MLLGNYKNENRKGVLNIGAAETKKEVLNTAPEKTVNNSSTPAVDPTTEWDNFVLEVPSTPQPKFLFEADMRPSHRIMSSQTVTEPAGYSEESTHEKIKSDFEMPPVPAQEEKRAFMFEIPPSCDDENSDDFTKAELDELFTNQFMDEADDDDEDYDDDDYDDDDEDYEQKGPLSELEIVVCRLGGMIPTTAVVIVPWTFPVGAMTIYGSTSSDVDSLMNNYLDNLEGSIDDAQPEIVDRTWDWLKGIMPNFITAVKDDNSGNLERLLSVNSFNYNVKTAIIKNADDGSDTILVGVYILSKDSIEDIRLINAVASCMDGIVSQGGTFHNAFAKKPIEDYDMRTFLPFEEVFMIINDICDNDDDEDDDDGYDPIDVEEWGGDCEDAVSPEDPSDFVQTAPDTDNHSEEIVPETVQGSVIEDYVEEGPTAKDIGEIIPDGAEEWDGTVVAETEDSVGAEDTVDADSKYQEYHDDIDDLTFVPITKPKNSKYRNVEKD